MHLKAARSFRTSPKVPRNNLKCPLASPFLPQGHPPSHLLDQPLPRLKNKAKLSTASFV